MITVEAHLATVLAAVRPVESTTLSLHDAWGSTLRLPIRARVDSPVFDNSAMDGFAVRYDDVARASAASPAVVRVVADLPAGTTLDPALDSCEAARIMTGASVPTAADTIVPFEDTAEGLADSLGAVRIIRAPRAVGAHIRRRGEDFVAGAEIVAAGTELGPLQLAAAAAANVATVEVARRPRVAVVSTGSELVKPGATLAPGQIPESNSLLLAMLVRASGADLVLQTTVRDVDDDLRNALADAAALGADAVITSGGISAGAYEVVKSALADMTFFAVAMKPGKPQGFSGGHPLVFALPGNPVSAAVSFEVFVRPALLAMQGRTRLERRTVRLPAATGWPATEGRRQYVPIAIGDGGVVPVTGRVAHLAGGLGRAEGYAVIPVGAGAVTAGDLVEVILVP